jgi:hypothetical protein
MSSALVPVRHTQAVESGHVLQAHQHRRLHQVLLEEVDEAGAAGDEPRVLAVLGERGQQLFQAARGEEAEAVHALSPAAALMARTMP